MSKRASTILGNVIRITALIMLWQIGSMLIPPRYFPSPMKTLSAARELIRSGLLWRGIEYSFLRITGSAVISMGLAYPIAVLLYGIQPVRDALMPVVAFLRYLPVTAFGPLLIIWAGTGEVQKVAFLVVATFLYLLPSVLQCFDEVPTNLMNHAQTIGLTHWQAIREVLIPISLPSVLRTFLLMYGIGWTYVTVAEKDNAVYGLGYIITSSTARGQMASVFAAIITIVLVAVIIDKVGELALDKIFVWRRYERHD